MSNILSRENIRRLLDAEPPLIASYCSLEQQLQPNGFDLTLRQIALPKSLGRIGVDNSQRLTAALAPLVFDSLGFINLVPGAYIITFNEVVNLPDDVMALAWPRSSLLRCGVTIHTAVWDAGYSGRSQSLMVIRRPAPS